MAFIPLNKPSKTIVLDLLNRDNNKSFTFAQIDFTSPTANVGVKNTAITVVGKVGMPYAGQTVPVTYNRLDLGILLGADPVVLDGEFWDTTTFLPVLNTAAALGLTADDVVYAGMNIEENELSVTIGTSYAYLPTTSITVKEGFIDYTDRLYQLTTQDLPSIIGQDH